MSFLTQPVKTTHSMDAGESRSLSAVLRPGDVLADGRNSRAAVLIKYITGSAWSHVAMYVGPLAAGDDPPCVVEADIEEGVRAIRLSELNALHVRVLRPVGLSDIHRIALAEWTLARARKPVRPGLRMGSLPEAASRAVAVALAALAPAR